jgi:L-fuculose-phosphate aldolase
MHPSPRAPSERDARRDVVEVCRRTYAHGWLAATDGNVSVLLGPDRILTTPTGVHKGYLREEDLIVVDRRGQRVSGARAPSSELAMHLAAYDERPDVGAVVHAHPTNCIAFSIAGVSLAQCLLPEIVFTFGSIPTTAYTTPTTEEVPNEVRKWLRDFDAMILDRHGSLTVGADVYAAYDKLERMEHVAEITLRARMLGPIRPLEPAQIARLQDVGRGLGLPPKKILSAPCEHCNACPSGAGRAQPPRPAAAALPMAPPPLAAEREELVRRVTESIASSLGRR